VENQIGAGNQFGAPPPPPAPKIFSPLDMGAMQGTTQNLTANGERDTMSRPDAPVSGEERKAGTISEVNNPASPVATVFGVTRESRVSMNVPTRKLETPELPGYHLHWFLRTNIPPAIRAGYEYVEVKELPTMDKSIGGRPPGTNTEDLGGAQITHIAGLDEHGKTVELVLMKIRLEWYFDDQKQIAARNRSVLQMIFKRKMAIRAEGESERDYSLRYTREAVIDMSNGRFKKT
jgi:hypothetical protein